MPRENNYFYNLSKDLYDGILVTDILATVKIADIISDDIRVFYPYQIKYDETPDVVAYNYYDDVDLDWLVLLSNGIIDPYYDWPLSDHIFAKYIIKKYGSVNAARQGIKTYVLKENENVEMSVDSYEFISNPTDWRAVSCYEYERIENDNKRVIRLLDNRHAGVAIENLRSFYTDNNRLRNTVTPNRNVSGLIS